MPTNASEGRTALVTGASGGIGAELARQIAGDGYDVILTARREDRLEDIAAELEERHGITATVIPKDLAERDAPRDLFAEVQDGGHDVHTLVNNAGFPVYGRFEETPVDEELALMQVNMVALTHLTKLFLQPMTERGEGAILNMASAAAYYPTPRLAVYGATKAYVLSFSRAIAHELADEGIQVTALCPGEVDTDFYAREGLNQTKLTEGPMNDPAAVAAAGWEGLKSGDRIVRPAVRTKFLTQLPRILPERVVTSLGASGTERTSG